jgi:protein TonB
LPATLNDLIASKPIESAASAAPQPPEHPASSRQDFGWLMETILHTIEPLKQYPPSARLEWAEGKVVVKMVIHEDGRLSDIEVVKSSGYPSLDQAAMDVFRLAGPIALPRPLGKPTLTVRIPMNYAMDRR